MVRHGPCKTETASSILVTGLYFMSSLDTKQKGDVSELSCMTELASLGYDVYTPFGENTPIDIICDIDSELNRIQVKTGWIVDGDKVKFNCKSTRSNFTETSKEDYQGKIDAFMVYEPESENIYYIPIEEATKTRMSLRLEETKNGQSSGINMASDYLISKRI